MSDCKCRKSTEGKARKETRHFQPVWREKYGFVPNNDRAICTLCNESVTGRTYNVRRHYSTKHEHSLSDLTVDAIADYIRNCVRNYEKERWTFTKFVTTTKNQSTDEGYDGVTHWIAQEVEDETPAANAGASTESSPSSRQPSPSPSGMTGPYLLKKETHCHNILDELLKDETYADVTLTAEGQTIKAHRIILSLSSKYFQNVLSPEPNAKNILLFRDMKFQELKNIINFIYTGEVTVDATDLDSFMKTADILEVTSLCNSQTKFPKGFKLGNYSSETEPKQSQSKRPNSNSQSSPPAKVRKTSNEGVKQTKKSILSTTTSELKTKKSTIATPSSFRDLVSIASDSDTPKFKEEIIEEEEEAVEPNILQAECILSDNENDPGDINAMQSSCISCSSKFDTIDLMFQHLERDHENDELFPCEVCIQIFASSSAFDRHKINCKSKSSHLRVT